jgi:ferredoxin
MRINKINLVYFSPTKTTQKVVRAIARGAGLPVQEYDFTCLYDPPAIPSFGPEEVVLIGMPVYVGRVPAAALGCIDALRGSGTPCVLAGVYGNRHFDDYLVELEDLVRKRGFVPTAAAAFIGEHSFSDKLAGGRPDAQDLEIAESWGKTIAAKLEAAAVAPALTAGTIPGNRPYRAPFRQGSPLAPVVNEKCRACGACAAACPTGAIHREEVRRIAPEKCIKCRSCARVCPEKAIDFVDKTFWAHTEELVRDYGGQYKKPALVF